MTRVTNPAPSENRWSWHDWVVAGLGFQALAVAIWLVPASIRIVSWPAAGPVRLAFLAPSRQLAWLTILALGALAAAWFLSNAVARSRRNASLGAKVDWSVPSVLAPLNWLWLWAVPYLPWLPDRAPLLLVLAGPLRWAVAAAALAAVALRWRPGTSISGLSRSGPAWGRGTVFLVSLAFNMVFGLYSARTLGVGGDEPHYLVIAQSLIRDGDLAIENNHERGDYREYYNGPLRPDYMRRGIDGRIYSVHAPGLPALLIPAFLAAGARGATLFIAFVGALAAMAIFDLACLIAGRLVAWAVWAAVCLSVPFVPHSWLIFPEMPGALIVAWCVLWIVQRADVGAARWALRGVGVAVLAWLHTKFVVFQALLGLAVAARAAGLTFAIPGMQTSEASARWRPDRAAAFLAPNVLSGLLWLYSFYVLYGAFNPEAAYGAYVAAYVLASNIPHSLVGLFLDQKFGLLFYAPVYLAAVGGFVVMLRDAALRRLGMVLGVVVVVFMASTARLYMFWGGSSAPARFLVPLLPCLAPMLAVAFMRFRGQAFRGLVTAAIAGSALFTVAAAAWPQSRLFYSDPHGRARVLQTIEAGAPLADTIPTFTDPDWADQIGGLAPWLLAAICATAAVLVAGRRGASPARATTTFLLVGGGVAALIVPSPRTAEGRDAVAARGALHALWEFDGGRHRALDYARGGRPSADRLRDLRTLRVGGGVVDGQFRSDAVTIPPGAYDVVVWFKGTRPREGRVRALELPDSTVALVEGQIANPVTLRIELPVRARALTTRVDGAAAAADVAHVDVVPLAVKAPDDRPPFQVRTFEPIPGPPHAFVVYTDENVYPEGGVFWTRGTADTQAYVAPAGARRLRLTLSTGPRDGEVRIVGPAGARTEPMRANEPREVMLDLPAGQELVPLRLGASVMFRPGEADPASSDMRALGCRVLLALE